MSKPPSKPMKRFLTQSCFAAATALALNIAPAHAVVTNVALVGTASQSTTRAGTATQGDLAQVGVDGNTNGVFEGGSVTHTNTQDNPWWEIDLKADRSIDDIVVWNRLDGLQNRLNGYTLSVLDSSRATVFSSNPTTPNPSEITNAGGVTGRFVRIDLAGVNRVLSVAEVQVMSDISEDDQLFFGNGRNLALTGSASQSTTRTGAPKGNSAILAIDGNTDGSFGDLSVTHTLGELAPTWTVDLNSTNFVEEIIIHERTDGCCNNRLTDFNVEVLDAGMNSIFSTTVASVNGSINLLTDYGTEGQFVRVSMNNNGGARTLELAEVEVLGGSLQNVARNPNAVASQSSTRVGSGGNDASFAIDGITDGVFLNGSVTHTNNEPSSFWEVDLGGEFLMDELVLFNRTDCCEGRLSNFRVSVFNGLDEVFGQDYFATGFVDESFRIALDDLTIGDRVRVQFNGLNNDGNGTLSLAEVQVWGAVHTPEPASAGLTLMALSGLAMVRRRRAH